MNFYGGTLTKQLGLIDVTKQYLYQLDYKEFIKEYEFEGVKNAFLFPTYEDEIYYRGYVKLDILCDLDLEKIQVIMVPAHDVNHLYLTNGKMEFEDLWSVLDESKQE